ncbi:MAG: rane protein [Bacteroidota bacterium]|jgi:membrane associated rhomboid family serine protease|nr:rane protein [Bacteroidota bacterium]
MKQFPLKELISVTLYPIIFLVVCWGVFIAGEVMQLDLVKFGISPRTVSGLKGIAFAPFIHGDLNHILNNSLPILILGTMIFYFYKTIAWPSVLWIYLISGFWLWVGGRNNEIIPVFHIGASTLIYGFSTFLFFSGVFRKHKQLMMVSAFVVFTYGSITWGIFPFDKTVSWEGHLFGSVSGVLVAFSFRKDGPQPAKIEWPEEERDLEAEYNNQLAMEQGMKEMENEPSSDPLKIIYHYKESSGTGPSEVNDKP